MQYGNQKKVEKRFCFIFQKQWNKKTCGCRPWTNCQKIEEEVNNCFKSPLEK